MLCYYVYNIHIMLNVSLDIFLSSIFLSLLSAVEALFDASIASLMWKLFQIEKKCRKWRIDFEKAVAKAFE